MTECVFALSTPGNLDMRVTFRKLGLVRERASCPSSQSSDALWRFVRSLARQSNELDHVLEH